MGDLLKGALAPIFEDTSPIPAPNTPVATPKPAAKVEEKPEPKPVEKKKMPPPGKPLSLGSLGISVRPQGSKPSNTPTSSSNSTVAEKPETAYGVEDFNLESLRSKWLEFANNQDNILKQTLRSVIPNINGTEVQIVLHNAFQKDKVDEISHSLLTFIRRVFNNNELSLSVKIAEMEANAKAFTPKEKMTDMLKENPALANLIEKFGLEIE